METNYRILFFDEIYKIIDEVVTGKYYSEVGGFDNRQVWLFFYENPNDDSIDIDLRLHLRRADVKYYQEDYNLIYQLFKEYTEEYKNKTT